MIRKEKYRMMNENEVSKMAFHTCYQIHVAIGSGLLESVYEEILYFELM